MKKRWNITDSQARLTQEMIIDDYKRRGAIRTPEDEDSIRSFFSPSCVPAGLTNAEVATCIRLYPRKKELEDILTTARATLTKQRLEAALRNPNFRKETRKFYGSIKRAKKIIPLLKHLWPEINLSQKLSYETQIKRLEKAQA